MAAAKSGKQRTSKRHHSLYEHLHAHLRFIIAVLVGVAFWIAVPLSGGITRVLAAWNVAGWLYVLLIGTMMLRCEIEGIKRQASLEEESRTLLLILTTFASVAMVLAIVAQLSALHEDHSSGRTLKFALSFSTILVSWFLVHMVFALYYAHEFHSESHERSRGSGGGLKFPGEHIPDYLDFVYFSFVVGTTAQTSDVLVSSRKMRHVVTLHGLLSFFFNTTVIALVVNLTSQLAG
ncbi:MAG: DUF1345 domain-containing protein [Methyloceanibacter sp.]